MDFFVVPTISFGLLYALVIIRLDRAELVWVNVTANPTAEWIARQITEAFPWDETPRYLIRDRDRIYGTVFTRRNMVDREVRGAEGASDHAPAWIILRDAAARPRKQSRTPPKATQPKTTTKSKGLSVPKLLVIDGDSFAHRSYHALPKSIRRSGNKPTGAILGFPTC